MPDDTKQNSGLYNQIKEAYGRVLYSQTTHVKQYLRLEKRHRCIKITQIFISAISTGGIIGSIVTDNVITTLVGAIFATVLLFINLYFKDFDFGTRMSQHRKASDELWLVREQYISLLTDFETIDDSQIREKRDDLQEKTNDIYMNAPKTDGKSYAEAQKVLKSEEEQFFSPDELDKLLPKHLRSDE